MSEISAALVKKLRETTGVGMMDCKRALEETKGDFETAIDWLRKKGIAAASKKSSRVAAEGLVAVAFNENKTVGAVIELNSETDFVARNDKFQNLVANIASAAVNVETLDQLKEVKITTDRTVKEEVTENIAVIGENLNLRRMAKVSVTKGLVASYVHNHVAVDMGKIAVLVGLESSIDAVKLQIIGRQIAMHIAAVGPQSLDVSSLDPAALERERAVLVDQARASGRPEEVIQKMVEGRVRKFYEEVVLLEQTLVMDGKTRIADVVENFAKEIGTPVTLKAFARFALGEGIEKQETDFAAEVQAQAKIAG